MDESSLLNPDEFEEIAEIYDQIRSLHAKLSPAMDASLAQDFDLKLREVMEVLSVAVNSDKLLKSVKREKSLSAKVDLLTTCAEKVFDYVADLGGRRGEFRLLNGVLIGLVDGIRDAYEDLQTSHMEVVGQLELTRGELARNQNETH
jgi:hypothetical protein